MTEAGFKKLTVKEMLRDDIKDGGITLVLGSGINHGAGLPKWDGFLSGLIPSRPIWEKELKKTVPKEMSENSVNILTAIKLLEQLRYKQRGGTAEIEDFTETVKSVLYRGYKDKKPDDAASLKTIGDALIKDRRSNFPKIRRVITFNVDSLLEEYILDHFKNIKPHPITQWYQSAMHYKLGVDIYHLHGFLPSDKYRPYRGQKNQPKYENPSKDVVFGDDEYWEMTSRPASLPNVVIMNALHDSHCVFIGLSMTDPNIARWLALRANEIKMSKREQTGSSKGIGALLSKHYWFEKSPDRLRIAWLKSRGVKTLPLNRWDEFPDMFKSLFNVNGEGKVKLPRGKPRGIFNATLNRVA